jgi:hypothetical protein
MWLLELIIGIMRTTGESKHTASIELPIKISSKFYGISALSLYAKPHPNSTEKYYTSDYDLSKFVSNQYGLGLTYTDIFTQAKIFILGLKSIDLRLNHYERRDGLSANIASMGFKFV